MSTIYRHLHQASRSVRLGVSLENSPNERCDAANDVQVDSPADLEGNSINSFSWKLHILDIQ
jgi:hypothetical protein